MELLWTVFWPMAVGAAAIGAVAGVLFFGRHGVAPTRKRKQAIIAGGFVATLAIALLSSGPFGGADRFTGSDERRARDTMVHYEVGQVRARYQRSPLRRRFILAGPADEFQRTELVRIMEELPGVSEARWNRKPAFFPLPLVVEVCLLAIVGYLVGLILAYIVELRRRSHRYDRI
ncbi:hypothetical protein H9L12_10490 [Sphingomonas rhizophila]|uniref:Uncharacterized protein n=1 Tax=Sphingomonas rhizophila TaxID=2071607 RepID=A0A7G9SA16_9SPHN|nr:hypothetical protein [Sphingomonas rhizophila]QNN64691.1 hypothetical protein H9L12_10490 [Sphingomonas rhizophila]